MQITLFVNHLFDSNLLALSHTHTTLYLTLSMTLSKLHRQHTIEFRLQFMSHENLVCGREWNRNGLIRPIVINFFVTICLRRAQLSLHSVNFDVYLTMYFRIENQNEEKI